MTHTVFYSDILEKAVKRASIQFDRLITVNRVREVCKANSRTRPRWFCMAYMHAIGRHSQPQIAKAFQLSDHTTVLYGLRRAHGHDGKLLHRFDPLWNKELFENLVRLDGFTEQPIVSATSETIQEIGEQNLKLFVNGQGWRQSA